MSIYMHLYIRVYMYVTIHDTTFSILSKNNSLDRPAIMEWGDHHGMDMQSLFFYMGNICHMDRCFNMVQQQSCHVAAFKFAGKNMSENLWET